MFRSDQLPQLLIELENSLDTGNHDHIRSVVSEYCETIEIRKFFSDKRDDYVQYENLAFKDLILYFLESDFVEEFLQEQSQSLVKCLYFYIDEDTAQSTSTGFSNRCICQHVIDILAQLKETILYFFLSLKPLKNHVYSTISEGFH